MPGRESEDSERKKERKEDARKENNPEGGRWEKGCYFGGMEMVRSKRYVEIYQKLEYLCLFSCLCG